MMQELAAHEFGIKLVTRERNTRSAEDRGFTGAAFTGRREGHEREVGGAAAEIADEHELVLCDESLVIPRSRDGFELEFDLFEADELGGFVKTFRGKFFVWRIAGKFDGTTEDDAVDGGFDSFFGSLLELPHHEGNEIGKFVAATVDAGLGEGGKREKGLQRLQEAALKIRADVGGDGVIADKNGILFLRGKVEERRDGPADFCVQWRGRAPVEVINRNRRVTGAKINSANVISHGEFVPGFRGTSRTL